MNRYWPLVAAVVAIAVAGWLLLRSPTTKRSAEEALARGHDAEKPPPPPAPIPGAALDAPRGADGVARPKPEKGPHGSVDVRSLPHGPLIVNVVGTDDKPLDPAGVRVEVGPAKGDREWPSTPLLSADPETRTWKADSVLAGPVEVRVTGEHLVEKVLTVQVSPETSEPVKVRVEPAGAIRWSVTLTDGQVPEQVEVSLLDERERPVTARFQTQSATSLSTPRTGTRQKEGSEGLVLGVKPGRYVFRATSPAEQTTDTKVDVVAGETVALAISIRG